jgi:hypothetical protein
MENDTMVALIPKRDRSQGLSPRRIQPMRRTTSGSHYIYSAVASAELGYADSTVFYTGPFRVLGIVAGHR